MEVAVAQWGDHQDRPERGYYAFEAPLRGGQIASSGTRTVYGSPPVPFQRLGEGIVSPYSSLAFRLPWICRGDDPHPGGASLGMPPSEILTPCVSGIRCLSVSSGRWSVGGASSSGRCQVRPWERVHNRRSGEDLDLANGIVVGPCHLWHIPGTNR
jgi:hypothetical protein